MTEICNGLRLVAVQRQRLKFEVVDLRWTDRQPTDRNSNSLLFYWIRLIHFHRQDHETMSFAPAGRRQSGASPHPSASATPGGGGENAGRKSSAASPPSQLCTLCSRPAALTLSSSLVSRPFCLSHYYTSRAVRMGTTHPDRVHLLGRDGGEILGIDHTAATTTQEESEMAQQLPELQEVFAQAFAALRDRIVTKLSSGGGGGFGGASSSSLSTGQTKGPEGGEGGGTVAPQKRKAHDPLADLLGGPCSPSFSTSASTIGKKRGRKRPPSKRPAQAQARPKLKSPATNSKNNKEDNEGGFVRDTQLPPRYVEQQRRMAREEVAERRRWRMAASGTGGSGAGINTVGRTSAVGRRPKPADGAAAAPSHVEPNPYKRRRPNRSSIWNLALEGGNNATASGSGSSAADPRPTSSSTESERGVQSSWEAIERSLRPTVRCTCGSEDVSNDLNITGRGNDMPKGETWGSKDRSDVVVRYRCGRCGKTWNEEE